MTGGMRVPFLDLPAQHRAISADLHAAVAEVLDSGQFILGPKVQAFEAAFAGYCGTRHAVGVNTGTSALHLALLALEIGPGDEVITVPMTFVATVAAILYAGATPRFVDVDPETWNMDPAALEAAIGPRTRAIMPVHLHGRMADMARIMEIADRHGIPVIEDAAQAHGAERDGRRAGSLGVLGCFSFYPGKNLGACGEGGAVVTDREDLAQRIRVLRDWGQTERYLHTFKGFNYRMDGIQGAALGVKLPHLDLWTDGRRAVAAAYRRHLSGDPRIGLPAETGERDHVWHVFAVRVRERDRVRRALDAEGIATGIHYPIPVHLQPAYAELGYGPGDFPHAESFANETLSLPIFPELSPAAIERVCGVLTSLEGLEGRYVVAA